MFSVTDCIADSFRPAVQKPTEWQHIGNEIDAAFVFAGTDFVNVHHSSIRRDLRAVSSKIDVRSRDGLLVPSITNAYFRLVARYQLKLAAPRERDVVVGKLKRGLAL